MNYPSTRRLILQASLFGASFGLPGFASAVLSFYSTNPSGGSESGFKSIANIVYLGNSYCREVPGEAATESLVRLITLATREAPLDQIISQEFTQGKVTYLDGWVLSITEARYYALIALNSNPQGY